MHDDSTSREQALRRRLADVPLWDFALALYARDGVEAACLMLQDEAGLDVCELLWHAWLYHHGALLAGEPPALAAVRRWQREVTLPLRTLRRRLKPAARHAPGVADVRRELQRAELAAERETLHRLQHLAEHDAELTALPLPRPALARTLAGRWQLQKKSQLSALQTLESQLDPP
ncbi:TIGR02444 family protein [Billgrantia azerbaijanica]|nr:TIGR02444 family protein [Halomonas azerbaijanica]